MYAWIWSQGHSEWLSNIQLQCECVCVCVCVYIYIYIYIYTYIHTCMHAYIHTYIRVYIYIYTCSMNVCVDQEPRDCQISSCNVSIHVCTHPPEIFVCVWFSMYACMYVCMYASNHVSNDTYTYIHTTCMHTWQEANLYVESQEKIVHNT